MKYYSSGEFAIKSGVTLRTVRYYDKVNILKPSMVKDSGARFYTEEDFARLQQILFFKHLGYSLKEIKELSRSQVDAISLLPSIQAQHYLIKERMEQMMEIERALQKVESVLKDQGEVDWPAMMRLIRLTGQEQTLKSQYRNASNIAARIRLHSKFSTNQLGWFPWIYEKLNIHSDMRILEIGCGDGSLWKENLKQLNLIPGSVKIVLTDCSEGMLRDAKKSLGIGGGRFVYQVAECEKLPFQDNVFDVVIANHVMFYCLDILKGCKEVFRVLKPGGHFFCSTYGKSHMKEIVRFVKEFDDRITLSNEKLSEKFGKENGKRILGKFFENPEWKQYEDNLIVTEDQPLLDYIMSCYGNQGEILSEQLENFCRELHEKTREGFCITKDVGIFSCIKS